MKKILLTLILLAPTALWAVFALPPGAAAPYCALRLPGFNLSVEVPSGWLLDDSDAQTQHLVQLYGPWMRNVDHPIISVFYYGPGSAYASKDTYAKRRLAAKSGGWEEKRTVTTGEMLIRGEAARTYTADYVDTFGAYGDLHREPARENVVLLDSPKGGFFVFRYRAAKAIYNDYYAAFQRLLASAKAP